MADTSQADNEEPKRKKRRSWSLKPELEDVVVKESRRLGINVNATLNVMLTELLDWRAGRRRFHEAAKGAGA